MDFIIKLLPLEDTITGVIYDSILVIVDRLTKYAQFIPWRKKESADKLAKAMLKKLSATTGYHRASYQTETNSLLPSFRILGQDN